MDNIIQIVRERNKPTSNLSVATVYRRLVSIVERYNIIARSKGLPTKKIPVYNKHMNDDLLKRLMCNILRDINRIKNINDVKEKILTGVTFEGNMFTNGIWTYTIIEDTNNVGVKLNTEAFSTQFTGDTITLDYEHMPYERLIDTEGNEYITSSYVYMFANGKEKSSLLPNNITSLTIDNWTNGNVTVMLNMFIYCKSLISLTLGDNFDISKVTDMESMFEGCSSLITLTLGNKFNTINVCNMYCMFYNCSALTKLDLGANFNTSRVTDMNAMFWGCSMLESLSLGNKFDTTKVKDMNAMFYNCSMLSSLSLGNGFNTTNVTDMGYMFYGCSTLESLSLGAKFDTTNVTIMSYMFYNCSALTTLDLGANFDTTKVTQMSSMFGGCNNLASVSLYKASTSIVKMLPAATWIINGNTGYTIETYVNKNEPAEWSPSTLPNSWGNDQWTLTRTI